MVPLAVAALEIAGARRPIVMVTAWLPVPVPFCAVTLAEKVPCDVGVPEIRPVALTLKPGASPVALKLVGLFVAVI